MSDANETLKEQKSQLAARDSELDRINSKVEEYTNNNAELKENINTLEEARSELRKKVHENELLVQKLEREKHDLNAEVEVKPISFQRHLFLISPRYLNHALVLS